MQSMHELSGFFISKSVVRKWKSAAFSLGDHSFQDVESKNASSLNVTLSLFQCFLSLVTKLYCFAPKYSLPIYQMCKSLILAQKHKKLEA